MGDAVELMVRHHSHLATWLSDGDPSSLDDFLNAHHHDFSLVTTSGEILELGPLRAGLSRAGGSRPGLEITIRGMTSLTRDVHRFIEHHTVDGHEVDARVVTVVLRDGLVLALQETACTLDGPGADG